MRRKHSRHISSTRLAIGLAVLIAALGSVAGASARTTHAKAAAPVKIAVS